MANTIMRRHLSTVVLAIALLGSLGIIAQLVWRFSINASPPVSVGDDTDHSRGKPSVVSGDGDGDGTVPAKPEINRSHEALNRDPHP